MPSSGYPQESWNWSHVVPMTEKFLATSMRDGLTSDFRMPHYTDKNFVQACKALAQVPDLRKEIKEAYHADAPRILEIMERGEPLPDELSGAYDHVVDVLSDAPEIEVFEAEQDEGIYHVTIRGFPGAYFVQAVDYDDSEVFLTQDEAESYVQVNFGEFLC